MDLIFFVLFISFSVVLLYPYSFNIILLNTTTRVLNTTSGTLRQPLFDVADSGRKEHDLVQSTFCRTINFNM